MGYSDRQVNITNTIYYYFINLNIIILLIAYLYSNVLYMFSSI